MTSTQTIERAEKLFAIMRQSPELGVWKSSSSKLFRVWAKECGLTGATAYRAFSGCIVHLGLQGLVQRTGLQWHLVGGPIGAPERCLGSEIERRVI